MNKRQRDIEALVRRAGLVIIETGSTGSGHISVVAQAANECVKRFVFSRNSSDHRADKNNEQDLRRFARENQLPPQEAKPAPQPPKAAPDQPTTQPTTMTTKPSAKKHQTSHAEFYRLCEWMKTADLTGAFTYAAVVELAKKHLTFIVTMNSVQNAMEAVGVKLPERPPAESTKRDRTQILARELAGLLRELGKDPSDDLMSIINRTGA